MVPNVVFGMFTRGLYYFSLGYNMFKSHRLEREDIKIFKYKDPHYSVAYHL